MSTWSPRGLVAFPITPTEADGRVDAPAFARVLRRLADAELDAVCVLGSTGTYAYLAREERRRALAVAADTLGGRTPWMAGVGALATAEAVACARDAAAAGARLGLLAPVSYTPLTADEVVAHYARVADEGGLPLCVYDNPAATHHPIDDALLQRLAALPGVVASKSPAPPSAEASARVAALRAATPAGFSVGFSVDWTAPHALIAGGDAWYSVLAGLFPAPLVAMRHAIADGRAEVALALHARLEPLWALMRAHSGLRVVYVLAQLAGLGAFAPPAPIRLPAEDARSEIGRVFAALRPMLEGDADPI